MSKFYELIFTDHNLNPHVKIKERNLTLDFARGMAVAFMVFVHVLMTYSNIDVQYSGFGAVVDFLGSPPAAPVFMFTMGVFFILSSKTDSLKNNLIRGFKLILVSIVFSFLREDIMVILESYLVKGSIFDKSKLVLLWEVDILQFAGWAYIVMTLIKHYIKKPIWWLVIAVSVMMISPLLWGIESNTVVINWLYNYLWGSNDLVYFPLFAWLYYPLLGMVFGVMMKSSDDINSLYSKLLKPGLILLGIGSAISLTNLDFHIGDYFRGGQGSMIWITGFLFIWLWAINELIGKRGDSKIIKLINYWGKETTTIYIIHWLMISWGTALLGYEYYGYISTLLLMGFILLLTHYLSRVIKIRI